MKGTLLVIPSLLAALFVLGGCGSDNSTATAEQTKAFDGGPMPDSAKQRMAEGLSKAQEGAASAADAARRKAQGGG